MIKLMEFIPSRILELHLKFNYKYHSGTCITRQSLEHENCDGLPKYRIIQHNLYDFMPNGANLSSALHKCRIMQVRCIINTCSKEFAGIVDVIENRGQ